MMGWSPSLVIQEFHMLWSIHRVYVTVGERLDLCKYSAKNRDLVGMRSYKIGDRCSWINKHYIMGATIEKITSSYVIVKIDQGTHNRQRFIITSRKMSFRLFANANYISP